MTKIGKRITQLRVAKEMTRYRLAKESNISFSYLNNIEEDKHNPSLDIIIKISNCLGVTLDELVKGEEESHEHTN